MSQHDGTNITTGDTTRTAAERRAYRDGVRARNIRRRAADDNDLRAALAEARALARFDRVLVGA